MDMHRKSSGAYDAAVRNKWIKDYTWFEKRNHDSEDYVIYAYENTANKVVYVGLTFDTKGRDYDHRREKRKGGDVLFKYYKSIGLPIPEMRIKMDGLNATNAQYYEDWYKKAYAEAGWKVLNIAPTGEGVSSLGYNKPIWTYDTCKEESKKYKTKIEFRKGNQSAYQVSVRKKWIDDFGFKDTHEVLCENSANAVNVTAYDKNGVCIGKWSSMQKAQEETGIRGLSGAINNPKRYTCGGYYWFKCPISDEEAKAKIEELKNGRTQSFYNGAKYKAKTVIMIDINSGVILKEFPSIKDAAIYCGCRPTSIWDCCKGRIQSSHGYKWEYKKAG